MTTLSHREIDLGSAVSVAKVEAVLRDHPADQTPRAVDIDLSRCRLLPPGAGWRLGNAMSRWAEHGQVAVTVPEPGDFSGEWFKTMTRSGVGLALGRFAREVKTTSGADITALVRDYYEDAGSRSSTNYAVVVDLSETSLVEGLDAFTERLGQMAARVGLDYGTLGSAARAALRQACFEGVENVLDHAFRSPYDPVDRPMLSYFSLGFHRQVDRNRAPGDEFVSYLKQLTSRLPTDRPQRGFVEVVVLDTGVGLAARQSQDEQIYDGPLATEVEYTRAALATAGTVKLEVGDSFVRGEPGLGYSYILEGLRGLVAFATLRTGRCLITLDASAPGGAASWQLTDQQLGYLPGTALHIVFPLISDQLQMPQ